MTSLRQIEANRRNASKSTGPTTEAGKQHSRRNAVRHGLTAETVIAPFEDAEDYRLFEAAITVDFNPETAVEREVVLRLANLLWRLRRASSIETGMLKIANRIVAGDEQVSESAHDAALSPKLHLRTSKSPNGLNPMLDGHRAQYADCTTTGRLETILGTETGTLSYLATRFLHLAAVDKGAFERLARYETALWRQVCQTIFMLDMLRRQNLDMKWLSRSARRALSAKRTIW